MRVVESQSLDGLCVLTSVDGKSFLRITKDQGPSVVAAMEEATPLYEEMAKQLLEVATKAEVADVFKKVPDVERFLERAVIRRIQAELLVLAVSDEGDEDVTEEDLSPHRVLH